MSAPVSRAVRLARRVAGPAPFSAALWGTRTVDGLTQFDVPFSPAYT